MITIQNLEVRFEVDGGGEGEEAAFAQYFEKYIQKWTRSRELAAARHKLTEATRALGDRLPFHDG